MCCGGEMEVFMEPMLPILALCSFAAGGHVGRALVPICAQLPAGRCYVVDDLEENQDAATLTRTPSVSATTSIAAHWKPAL